jgi:NhaP-type Na+/H+ or K+/H+ antiporter
MKNISKLGWYVTVIGAIFNTLVYILYLWIVLDVVSKKNNTRKYLILLCILLVIGTWAWVYFSLHIKNKIITHPEISKHFV